MDKTEYAAMLKDKFTLKALSRVALVFSTEANDPICAKDEVLNPRTAVVYGYRVTRISAWAEAEL
jgi:hypothetical protein